PMVMAGGSTKRKYAKVTKAPRMFAGSDSRTRLGRMSGFYPPELEWGPSTQGGGAAHADPDPRPACREHPSAPAAGDPARGVAGHRDGGAHDRPWPRGDRRDPRWHQRPAGGDHRPLLHPRSRSRTGLRPPAAE